MGPRRTPHKRRNARIAEQSCAAGAFIVRRRFNFPRFCYSFIYMEIRTKSVQETKSIARDLALEVARAKNQPSAFVIALSGALGAGKTTFAQGFAQALGIKERVLSPTFVIMKIYALQKRARARHFVHIDCYRIRSPRDLVHLGVKEIFKDARAIVLIEWPERIRGLIPGNVLWIRLKHGKKEQERVLTVKIQNPNI